MSADDLTGRLLVATPGLVEPTFARTVVLLLAHNEEGALGVVVNRPGALPASEVLPHLAQLLGEPDRVFIGGPVSPSTALCLGRTADGHRVVDTAGDDLAGVDLLRVLAGYAGWSGGQLEGEIAAGGWYVVDAERSDVFTAEPDDLYRTVLRRQPTRIAFASVLPADVRHN